MIQQLLSLFKTYPNDFCALSETGKENSYTISNLSFYFSHKVLMLFSVFWIFFHLFYFQHLVLRPQELFIQNVWFGRIFLPIFPPPLLYTIISIVAILLIFVLFLYKDKWIFRAIIAFIIIWLNLTRWSSGGITLSSNLFILAHVFALFIPIIEIKDNKKDAIIYRSLIWYYLGLFITYFLSGFWKIRGLLYNIIFRPEDINWLNPKAALYTSLIGYHLSDLPADHVLFLFSFPLLWQTGFLVTCIILVLSPLASFRQPLRIWAGVALIIFHAINNIAFDVNHYMSINTLAILFFPYQTIFPSIYKSCVPVLECSFTGSKGNASYERRYSNGDKDIFQGFYAYREKIADNNRILGGLLYIPLLDSIMAYVWKK